MPRYGGRPRGRTDGLHVFVYLSLPGRDGVGRMVPHLVKYFGALVAQEQLGEAGIKQEGGGV